MNMETKILEEKNCKYEQDNEYKLPYLRWYL